MANDDERKGTIQHIQLEGPCFHENEIPERSLGKLVAHLSEADAKAGELLKDGGICPACYLNLRVTLLLSYARACGLDEDTADAVLGTASQSVYDGELEEIPATHKQH